MVDAAGNYLVHPDRTREFGAQRGSKGNWQTDMPWFAGTVGTTQSISRVGSDLSGQRAGLALAPALLAGQQWVGVVECVPHDVFLIAGRNASATPRCWSAWSSMLCAAVLALIVARSLTGPILQLTAAVEASGRPDAPPIPVDAPGETGVLARAFARVMDEANAKAAAQEERRRIFETSQDLILISDSRGLLVQVSPSVETILGYRPEEMIGRNGIEFMHPDDLDQARA